VIGDFNLSKITRADFEVFTAEANLIDDLFNCGLQQLNSMSHQFDVFLDLGFSDSGTVPMLKQKGQHTHVVMNLALMMLSVTNSLAKILKQFLKNLTRLIGLIFFWQKSRSVRRFVL
jgi:nitrogenase subunit NifH